MPVDFELDFLTLLKFSMTHMKKVFSVAVLCASLIPNAFAETAPDAYFGFAGGSTHANLDCAGMTGCDKSDSGYKIYGGYKFSDNIALETYYANFGRFRSTALDDGSLSKGEFKLSGFGIGLAVTGDFSNDWNGVLRAGLARNRTKVDVTSGTRFSLVGAESSINGYIGAGLGYKLNSTVTLTGAIDYTQGKFFGEKIKATLYSIGASVAF